MEGKWTVSRCRCGDKACKKWRLDFAGAEGMVEEDEARLIVQAPAMAKALEDAQKRLRGAGMLGGADDPVNVVLTAIKGE